MLEYFYDEQLKKLTCYTYYDFVAVVASLTDANLDVNATASIMNFTFVYEDGTSKYFGFYAECFKYLKEELHLDIDVNKSFRAGQEHTLYFLTDPFKDGLIVETLPETDEEDSEVISNEIISLESTSEEDTLDLDIQSLYNEDDKKESKVALENFAKEKFNIDLNRRKSFENMVEQLKEELSK